MTESAEPVHPLFTKEGRRDPHAIYRRMRAEQPVCRIHDPHQRLPIVLVTRYDDCVEALKDPRLSKDFRKLPEELRKRIFVSEDLSALSQHMLNSDPPDHTRLRSLVAKAFTQKRVDAMLPRIQEVANGLLDDALPRGRFDFVADFAFLLPATVIAGLFGVPLTDRNRFRSWTQTLLATAPTPEARGRMREAARELSTYMHTLIEQRRAEPQDDLVSALVAAEENDERLHGPELVSMLFLLLFAGHDTSVNLLSNGMLALLQHPEERARLVQDPSLLETAVEEMLRFCGPSETTTFRFASEDLEIAGSPIRQYELVLCSLLSANRDEQKFLDPDRFDVGRDPNRHIAFAHGIHFCLGTQLARLEVMVALKLVLARLPTLRLDTTPEKLEPYDRIFFHALRSLPVALDSAI